MGKSAKKEKSWAEVQARAILSEDGYLLQKVHRIFPPLNRSAEHEVLVMAKFKPDLKVKDDHEHQPYAVWVREDGTGYVTVGW